MKGIGRESLFEFDGLVQCFLKLLLSVAVGGPIALLHGGIGILHGLCGIGECLLQVGAHRAGRIAIIAAGVGAILAASATAFQVIKWFGVAYLIWLGIQQFRAEAKPMEVGEEKAHTPRQLFLQGFLVNASNPKGIIFMLAVLPQFIDPHGPQFVQYAICTGTLFFTDAVVMSGYTLLAARVLSALRDPAHIRKLNLTFGGLFVGAGLLLAGFKRS